MDAKLAFESKNIWLRSMSCATDSAHSAQIKRLKASYGRFWSNAIVLARQIQHDVKNLTLHDESHFEALWERVDQIAGSDLVLSPLEVFVLGGAILLHDNANSLAAFKGGIEELRKTPEWRDAAAEWTNKNEGRDEAASLGAEATSAILFEVLRSLHAERAETLANLSFENGGQTFHLIEDDQLRTHLGDIIGQIAASHHWDITTLSSRLPRVRGALSNMPSNWTIRPVLIACLLRCADATQLDQQRAPDFLYAILNLRGVSELHWRAQNRLAAPVISSHDPSALIFSSTMSFGPDDAEAWWIAHDAIQVANRELQASNSLLRDLRLPPLAISRVEGALSPSALSEYVTVKGWRPVQAEIKISKVGKIVEMFGGEQLYGAEPMVAVRELIQNCADAIRFRRELEPSGSGYDGRITVRIRTCEDDETSYWLDIEDDGIGMSEAVLTGPLIDFGSSYLSSALVKSERPGLLSKGRMRIGQFGIGFFSCFMIANEVLVTSRPFDKGRDETRTLHFRDGLGHRPLLLDDRLADLSIMSTRVRLKLSSDQYSKLMEIPIPNFYEEKSVTISTLVGILSPMLDVDLFVEESGHTRLIHRRKWMEEDRLSWLRRITAAEIRDDAKFEECLAEAVPLLTFIDPADPALGLACIMGNAGAGVPTVGTLRASLTFNSFANEYNGAIDYYAGDASRRRGEARAGSMLGVWATEQARRHRDANTDLSKRVAIAERVADFGGDPSLVATMSLDRKLISLEEVLAYLAAKGDLYMPIKYRDFAGEQVAITVVRERHTGFVDSYRPGELEFVIPTIEAASENNSDFYILPTEGYKARSGFYTVLGELAERSGYEIIAEIIDRVDFARYVGQASHREGLFPGKMIGCTGLKIHAQLMQN